MKAGGGSQKGSAFERLVCGELSKAWTREDAIPSDSIFWRTAGSGGRATNRAKQGKETAGSYGDITFLDPIGEPLLKAFCFELKRGMKPDALDMIDRPEHRKPAILSQWWQQAKTSCEQAQALFPIIIFKRDMKNACAICHLTLLHRLGHILGLNGPLRVPMMQMPIDGEQCVIMLFTDFLTYFAQPYTVRRLLK